MTDLLNIWTILVYVYQAIGSSSVVYKFHKGIISSVLCGYEVIIDMQFFYFVRKSTSNYSVCAIHVGMYVYCRYFLMFNLQPLSYNQSSFLETYNHLGLHHSVYWISLVNTTLLTFNKAQHVHVYFCFSNMYSDDSPVATDQVSLPSRKYCGCSCR